LAIVVILVCEVLDNCALVIFAKLEDLIDLQVGQIDLGVLDDEF